MVHGMPAAQRKPKPVSGANLFTPNAPITRACSVPCTCGGKKGPMIRPGPLPDRTPRRRLAAPSFLSLFCSCHVSLVFLPALCFSSFTPRPPWLRLSPGPKARVAQNPCRQRSHDQWCLVLRHENSLGTGGSAASLGGAATRLLHAGLRAFSPAGRYSRAPSISLLTSFLPAFQEPPVQSA